MEHTICSAFAARVAEFPSNPAVLGDDGCLTYRQLGSAVAATRKALTDGSGRAAILCCHGANTLTALLAALASGRAYVPLEPTFPVHRLAHILADSRADVLITDAAHADLALQLAPLHDVPIIHIGATSSEVSLEDVLTGLSSPAQPDDPAYLLYTSGSTGEPKGVVQSHRNVLFGIANHVRNFGITPDDRTSVLTSFGYDMAVTDTFSAILSGAAIVPADIRLHGLGHLAQTLSRYGATIYHSTPTVYRYLLASLGPSGRLPSIRAVLLGGEEVVRHDVELARRHFAADTVFVNGYGTTEISFAAQNHLRADAPLDHAVVPIGRPLDGIEIVLDSLTGEIIVRCDHVALGYWGLPELTASRFLDYDGVRAYRTGDIAKRLPDGSLIYLGRADRMVKIRGYRVELGEIESQLAALPGVGQAAVVARDSAHGKEIVAYVVPARDACLEYAAIQLALAEVLPDFMQPRAIVVLDALPIGPTGKLDVKALPEPMMVLANEAAQDSLEQLISGIWADVLGVDRVDGETTFFALGGHSLLMALVQQRLEKALGHPIPLVQLFEHATVSALAAHLRSPVNTNLSHSADRMRRRRQAQAGKRVGSCL
ncbi:MAG TPA: thioester reductase [Micromonosporaceae bacterium]|nr:thioester reductase [Micromonosporaceae bacterium]